jgi:hypothetical protein
MFGKLLWSFSSIIRMKIIFVLLLVPITWCKTLEYSHTFNSTQINLCQDEELDVKVVV